MFRQIGMKYAASLNGGKWKIEITINCSGIILVMTPMTGGT